MSFKLLVYDFDSRLDVCKERWSEEDFDDNPNWICTLSDDEKEGCIA